MSRPAPGPRNLITDVAGLRVGSASDGAMKTGVTVVTGDRPFACGVHVMGGAPGTRETDILSADRDAPPVDALVLSGGSAFGLDACSGVMDGLRAAGRGVAVGPAGGQVRVPIVPGAILFDLLNGGDKDWGETSPYRALGARAMAAAEVDFSLGSVGAGTGATTATLKGGLGSASLTLPGGATVGALVAVNAIGAAAGPDGRFFAGALEIGEEFGGLGAPDRLPIEDQFRAKHVPAPGAATTIAVVATDAAMNHAQCARMAVAAHDGIARALIPAHTSFDGDLIFAAATGAGPAPDRVTAAWIAHAAGLTLARAIARAVHAARPAPGDVKPCWSEKFG